MTPTPTASTAAASTNVGSPRPPSPPTKAAHGTKASVGAWSATRSSPSSKPSPIPGPRWSVRPSGKNTKSGPSTRSSSITWGRSRTTCTRAPPRRNSSARRANPSPTISRPSTIPSAIISPTRSWASSPARPKNRSNSASVIGTRATTASSTFQKPTASKSAPAGSSIRASFTHPAPSAPTSRNGAPTSSVCTKTSSRAARFRGLSS